MSSNGKSDAPVDNLFERLWRDHESRHIPTSITPTARRRLRKAYAAGALGVAASVANLQDTAVSPAALAGLVIALHGLLQTFLASDGVRRPAPPLVEARTSLVKLDATIAAAQKFLQAPEPAEDLMLVRLGSANGIISSLILWLEALQAMVVERDEIIRDMDMGHVPDRTTGGGR